MWSLLLVEAATAAQPVERIIFEPLVGDDDVEGAELPRRSSIPPVE